MKVSGDRVTNWEIFRHQWEDYELGTGLEHRPEPVCLATLHSVMGKDCLEIFLTARPWAERGSWFCRGLFFVVLSETRPKLPLGQIVSGTNHATYDVYSPKALKALIYCKYYEYSTLYLVQTILPF